jgi:hypothetical protein
VITIAISIAGDSLSVQGDQLSFPDARALVDDWFHLIAHADQTRIDALVARGITASQKLTDAVTATSPP